MAQSGHFLACSRPAASRLPELGDRRHLAQQAQVVEAALIVTLPAAHCPLRGPADLALDLADKLPDALCRGIRRFGLQPRQHDAGCIP